MLYGDGTADIISQYVASTKIFDEQEKNMDIPNRRCETSFVSAKRGMS